MKRFLFVPSLLLVLPLVGGLYLALSGAAPAATNLAAPAADDVVERGAYLVGIMGCDDCHTPFVMGPQGPEPDMSLRLSGHPASLMMPPAPDLGEGPWMWVGAATNTAFAGPWGVSYARNLTPHATGLQGWPEEMFVRAIKTGWHMGVENSRRIQPPMPWPAYRHATEEDLKAVYAFLRTLPPIDNQAPEYQPPANSDQ